MRSIRSVAIVVSAGVALSMAIAVGAVAQTSAPAVSPTVPSASKTIQVTFVNAEVVRTRLQQYKGDDRTREIALREMFLNAGCEAKNLSEQAVPHQKQPNVICVLPGVSHDTIVVGAHFDHVPAGDGVVDNWSGAALLPTLLQSLARHPRQHTFTFVGFTGEEDGLVGSDFYVSRLNREQISDIQAMVNLDTMGLGPTLVWASQSDPLLVLGLRRMAMSLKLPLEVMNVDGFGESDEESFIRQKVCTVTVHSLTPSTAHILHHKEDTFSAIQFDDYYSTYRLLAGYLTQLDTEPVEAGHICKTKAIERPGVRGAMDRWRNFPRGSVARLLH
jgi:putative aminopeptidase FrvX